MGLAVGDKFPTKAAKAWGVSGKKAVVYFYGADGAPSCTKQAKAFDAASLDATVVGVRSDEGVKDGFSDEYSGVKFVVDEGNEVREEVGIAKDLFGFLPGRETYVLDKSGELGRARALGVVWISPPACMRRPPSTAVRHPTHKLPHHPHHPDIPHPSPRNATTFSHQAPLSRSSTTSSRRRSTWRWQRPPSSRSWSR